MFVLKTQYLLYFLLVFLIPEIKSQSSGQNVSKKESEGIKDSEEYRQNKSKSLDDSMDSYELGHKNTGSQQKTRVVVQVIFAGVGMENWLQNQNIMIELKVLFIQFQLYNVFGQFYLLFICFTYQFNGSQTIVLVNINIKIINLTPTKILVKKYSIINIKVYQKLICECILQIINLTNILLIQFSMFPDIKSQKVWSFQFKQMGLNYESAQQKQNSNPTDVLRPSTNFDSELVNANIRIISSRILSLYTKIPSSDYQVFYTIFKADEYKKSAESLVRSIMRGNMGLTNIFYKRLKYGFQDHQLTQIKSKSQQSTGSSQLQLYSSLMKHLALGEQNFFKERFLCVPLQNYRPDSQIPGSCIFEPIKDMKFIYILIKSCGVKKLFGADQVYDTPSENCKQIQFWTYMAITDQNKDSIQPQYFTNLLHMLAQVDFNAIKSCLKQLDNPKAYEYVSFGLENNKPNFYYLLRNTSNAQQKCFTPQFKSEQAFYDTKPRYKAVINDVQADNDDDMQDENANSNGYVYDESNGQQEKYQSQYNGNNENGTERNLDDVEQSNYGQQTYQTRDNQIEQSSSFLKMILKSQLEVPGIRRHKFYALKFCQLDNITDNTNYQQETIASYFSGSYGLKNAETREFQIDGYVGRDNLTKKIIDQFQRARKMYEQLFKPLENVETIKMTNQLTNEMINRSGDFSNLPMNFNNSGSKVFQMLIYTQIPMVVKMQLIYKKLDKNSNSFIQTLQNLIVQQQPSVSIKQKIATRQKRKNPFSQENREGEEPETSKKPSSSYNKNSTRKKKKQQGTENNTEELNINDFE